MSTPAVLYAAKSTKDPRGSIPTQLADAQAFAEAEGYEVVAEFKDEAASAYTGSRGPDLIEAKELAARLAREHGKCALIVQHTDRLARGDAIHAAHLIEHYLWSIKANVKLRSVQDDHNLDDMLRAVLIGERNHEDSARKAQAVKAGMVRTARAGKATGGPRTYGYRYSGDANRKGVLLVVEHEAAIVRRIFAEFVAGTSITAIARNLHGDGVPTLRGGVWRQSSVSGILRNVIYTGKVEYDGEVYDGNHEAILPPEPFEQAQQLLAARPSRGRGRPPVGLHLFRGGVLRCGSCGEAMVPRTNGGYQMYYCNGRSKLGREHCETPHIRRAEIDGAVYAYFEHACLDLEATREELAQTMAREVADVRTMCEAAEREEREAGERLARVKRDYLEGKLDVHDWHEFREVLTSEMEAAQAKLTQLERRKAEAVEQEGASASDSLAYVTELRRAVAGHVQNAEGVDAVRAALLAVFESFTLRVDDPRRDPTKRQPSHPHLKGVGGQCRYELVPTVRNDATPLQVALARAGKQTTRRLALAVGERAVVAPAGGPRREGATTRR